MNTLDMLDAYNMVAASHGLPHMQSGALLRTTTRHAEPEALWAAFSACQPAEGWLQFQSHQCAFSRGLAPPQASWGILLAAEAVTAQGESLAVRQIPRAGWSLLRALHGQGGDSLPFDIVTQLAHNPSAGRLRYRRYWQRDPLQGFVQFTACFIGFEKE
ncbi:MAG: hypothetical protein B7X31_10045 [Thiomonas sp. 13-66-29]|jgi:hypothetical protein|nr:MAG: hypothetical protein B7X31_10045 [Thiomonas sp. 13-66-29]